LKTIAACFLLLLSGCAGPLSQRLKHAEMPKPYKVSTQPLGESERTAAFEAYRGYVNDFGVQIGRRHFNAERLPDYFCSCGLREFAEQASAAMLNEKARGISEKLEEPFSAPRQIPFPLGDASWAASARNLEQLAAGLVLSVAIPLVYNATVSLVAHDIYLKWRVPYMIEMKWDEIRARGYDGRLPDVMRGYNQYLALSLGVSPTAESIEARKQSYWDLPNGTTLGVNASEQDWVDDFGLAQESDQLYLGYLKCKVNDIPPHARYATSVNDGEKFTKEFNREVREKLFPREGK
jgi:hypothetical protein